MKKFLKLLFILFVFIFAETSLCVAGCAYSMIRKKTPTIESNKIINNLAKQIAGLREKTTIPVLFPNKLPHDPKYKEYFISWEITNSGYIISIDGTKFCKGAKYCSLGMISAETAGNPQIYYDMQNKELTVSVQLAKMHNGYFTPGHAMGDYWPPRIEWRDKNVLFTISWPLKAIMAKQILVAMADSMLRSKD